MTLHKWQFLFTALIGLLGIQPIPAQNHADHSEESIELAFSKAGGFFDRSLVLELTTTNNGKIYYTLDGTRPSRKAAIYQSPINISETMVVRAVAYVGERRSQLQGHTYFINEPPSSIPVISIGITPWILFDKERGLFQEGSKPGQSWKKYGANFWTNKEVTANIEIFEKKPVLCL